MSAPMQQFRQILKRNRFLRHFLSGGLPFIVLLVGGSFALKEFRVIRYEAIDKRKTVDEDAMDEIKQVDQAKKKKRRTLEEEYEKVKEENLEEWSNIRGPRPWENSREYQDSQRANLDKRNQAQGR